jgi:multicomponent Na+:H+ antiporter subunit G
MVAVFQLVTTPIASHMVGRASFRGGQVRQDLLVIDELTGVLPREPEERAD